MVGKYGLLTVPFNRNNLISFHAVAHVMGNSLHLSTTRCTKVCLVEQTLEKYYYSNVTLTIYVNRFLTDVNTFGVLHGSVQFIEMRTDRMLKKITQKVSHENCLT